MSSRAAIDDFLAQRTLALVGASRGGRKFGNTVLKELRAKGYTVFPVHPHAVAIDGVACFPSLALLPTPVGGVVVVVPPSETEKIVAEAVAARVPRLWMQQGAESAAALALCAQHHVTAVAGECVLMFASPVRSFHRVHRLLRKLAGRLPV